MPFFLLSMQRPRILQLNGLCMQDFDSTEAALQCADRLFEKNKEEFGHAGNIDLDSEDPMIRKYQYVQSHGKKRTWSQDERKHLDGHSHLKGGVKQLDEAKNFLECMGPGDVTQLRVGEESTVKIKSVQFEKCEEKCKSLRSEVAKLSAFKDPFRGLSVKLKKRADAEPNSGYHTFHTELETIIGTLTTFIDSVEESIYEFEALEEFEVEFGIYI